MIDEAIVISKTLPPYSPTEAIAEIRRTLDAKANDASKLTVVAAIAIRGLQLVDSKPTSQRHSLPKEKRGGRKRKS